MANDGWNVVAATKDIGRFVRVNFEENPCVEQSGSVLLVLSPEAPVLKGMSVRFEGVSSIKMAENIGNAFAIFLDSIDMLNPRPVCTSE